MQRTSFIVHMVGDEPINKDKLFDVVFRNFQDEYIDVREFTKEEYLNIEEPEKVE